MERENKTRVETGKKEMAGAQAQHVRTCHTNTAGRQENRSAYVFKYT